MKWTLIILLALVTSCGGTNQVWNGTGKYYGEVTDIRLSEYSVVCAKHLSTIVTISHKDKGFVTRVAICGHREIIQIGDRVWIQGVDPTAKNRHTHCAYINGIKYEIE